MDPSGQVLLPFLAGKRCMQPQTQLRARGDLTVPCHPPLSQPGTVEPRRHQDSPGWNCTSVTERTCAGRTASPTAASGIQEGEALEPAGH